MKHSFLPMLFAVAMLCSCNDKPANKDNAMADDKGGSNNNQEELLKANREVMHAIETGDTAVLHKYIADDATDHGGDPKTHGDMKGQDIINMLANMHKDIDGLKIDIMQEAANNDHIFTYSRMTGTTNKPVWGMPAKTKMDMTSVDMVKVTNHKMTDHWTFMDPNEMMKMMGGGAPAHAGGGH